MNPSPIAREYLEQGYSTTCPIIDMHGHLGPFYGCYLPSSPLERMRHRLKRCGVRRIVCSHHSALACDAERGNALMQEVVSAHPDEFLGYWVINPNYPEATAQDLRSFDRRTGFVGLKFWPDYHLVPVTSSRYAPALDYADAHGVLVLVHTFGESPFDAPGMLAEVGERYPRARFLMGHSGYGEWERSVAIARDLPNVYLDLTSVFQALDFSQMPGEASCPALRCSRRTSTDLSSTWSRPPARAKSVLAAICLGIASTTTPAPSSLPTSPTRLGTISSTATPN